MDIQLIRADVTSLKVDAIVNPTSPLIHPDIAGRVLVREGEPASERWNGTTPLAVGSTIVTTGGNLFCRFVIHAVVPRMGEGDEDAKLRSTTWSALQRAEELAIGSIALPAMTAGAFGFSYERCAQVMLSAAVDFRPHARSLQRTIFCLFGKEPYDVFDRILQELER
jgi:O-acetyl-ADP-ribose deacetylase (regulator of RNase III)